MFTIAQGPPPRTAVATPTAPPARPASTWLTSSARKFMARFRRALWVEASETKTNDPASAMNNG